ncbi:MAG: cytochrome-c peroxidase [Bacteroidetes bacterium]|jgi:cytochrome c peroxidase|nr:cytochrome-c peroxidase [Bacteroidota bacterium]
MKLFSLCISLVFLLAACSSNEREKIITTEKQLGEILFFDPILSRDSSLSCGSCHKPEFAFADNVAFSKGVFGQATTRNTPSAMNLSDRNFYFWDGRSETLEHQAMGPVENSGEMDLPATILVKRLLRSERYKTAFNNVYGKDPSRDLISSALAAFERTLETSKSPFDKYMKGEDTTLFSESAKRGLDIFNNKGKCFDCHFGTDFTGNDQFRNIGLYNGKELNDKGRILISGKAKDLGAFKTPGLRNIAQTAPYMHNGMFKTLSEVIDYYDEPDKFVNNSINRDTLLKKPLGLTATEKKDLENFLLSLSDERFSKKK